MPDGEEIFFLPQKPYMPLGTFRHQLLFPHTSVFEPSDTKLRELLSEVQLSHVLDRCAGFDVEIDWAQV